MRALEWFVVAVGEYQTDREFADLFLSKQMAIISPVLGKYMLQIADFHTDTKLAGDLTILRSPTKNIGLRVRRPQYAKIHGVGEFTLRSHRTSGASTELEKIDGGLSGSWFGYFHSDDDLNLNHWVIIDLETFKRYPRSGREIPNKDNTTFFRVYRIVQFPVGILIAASENILNELGPMFRFAVTHRQAGLWDPTPRHLRRPSTDKGVA